MINSSRPFAAVAFAMTLAATTPFGAAATTPAPTTTQVPAPATAPQAPAAGKTAPAPAPAAGPAVFPSKIDPKYASLKAGTARRKTCDDQYKANKATGGNGGMKWLEKGGGYYSACSKHLKGA